MSFFQNNDHDIAIEKTSVGFFTPGTGEEYLDEVKEEEGHDPRGEPAFMIHSEVPEGIVIKSTPYGLGVFTDKDFKKGQVLYTGRWCEIDDTGKDRPFVLRTNIGDFAMTTEVHSVAVFGKKRQVFGFDGFMNHSCDPTTYSADEHHSDMGGTYKTVALKDIPAGTEVTCDYDLFEYDSRDKGITKCACGSKKCRGQAIGFKFIPKETQLALFNRVCPQVMDAYFDEHDDVVFRNVRPPNGIKIHVDESGEMSVVADKLYEKGDTLHSYFTERIDCTNVSTIIINAHLESDEAQKDQRKNDSWWEEDFGTVREVETISHTVSIGDNYRDFYKFDSFCDHSCDPNTLFTYVDSDKAGKEGEGALTTSVALRRILPGEKITNDYYSYNSFCNSALDGFVFECHCGANNCRKKIVA